MDVVLLIDVCSCSIDVWNGIKSYADAIVTKYHQVFLNNESNTVRGWVKNPNPMSHKKSVIKIPKNPMALKNPGISGKSQKIPKIKKSVHK